MIIFPNEGLFLRNLAEQSKVLVAEDTVKELLTIADSKHKEAKAADKAVEEALAALEILTAVTVEAEPVKVKELEQLVVVDDAKIDTAVTTTTQTTITLSDPAALIPPAVDAGELLVSTVPNSEQRYPAPKAKPKKAA